MEFDIIGDIHGQCAKLEALLRKLGYSKTDGAYRHRARRAIFVGDFIDRGPAQECSIDAARRMVDAVSALAVMANHELNAIAWHAPDTATPRIFKAVECVTKGLEVPRPTGTGSSTRTASSGRGCGCAGGTKALRPTALQP